MQIILKNARQELLFLGRPRAPGPGLAFGGEPLPAALLENQADAHQGERHKGGPTRGGLRRRTGCQAGGVSLHPEDVHGAAEGDRTVPEEDLLSFPGGERAGSLSALSGLSGQKPCRKNHAGHGQSTLLLLPTEEVETFRFRSISDTWLTVKRMEQSRTDYRGALLWMKDVSAELDPDTRKQMDKFRKVQAEVRCTKRSFDQLKTDVCQKVDLLGASRCNLLSHVLATYQTTLLHFWEKTSHTMAAIHENFRGCLHHEEPSREKKKKRKKSKVQKKDEDNAAQEELVSLGDDNRSSPTKEGETCESSWELAEEDKDGSALLEEILGGLTLHDPAPLSRQWSPVFGDTQDGIATAAEPRSLFLPSQLLDQNLNQAAQLAASERGGTTSQPVAMGIEHPQDASGFKAGSSSGPSKDLSAWFNLFADLDPLANPDTIGKSHAEQQLHNA
ncbi:islet cell autoantigen 1 isoform X2 [Syngnathus scovelli]|uniref:islet cell autoantigen 1 isoform X2 n=1 Tax=Syngnathus scovelli TaxID=161590 RepID=UPI00210FE90A|nr:islet cell autoantigen 1 isoform X2 [Syngnathus scovelli]